MKFRLAAFLLLISFKSFSQELVSISYDEKPLVEVLADIEKWYNVKFSYNTELIQAQTISINLTNANLDAILQSIKQGTHLEFKKINNRYYTITENKNNPFYNLQELEEVFIKEYPTLGVNKNRDGSISVLPDQLAILPGLIEPDVLQSLQILPGVQSPDETASGLYIRGATPDQNLVLWDGIKMYYSGHFFGILSAFNPYVTDKVKLTKNGSRARYGNALSGVIDITSTPEIPEKFNVGFGSNLTHTDVYFKAPITEKLGLVVSARRSFTDVLETITFTNFSDRVFQDIRSYIDDNELTTKVDNTYYFEDYTAKIISQITSKDKLTLSALYTKNDLNYNFMIEEDLETSTDDLKIKNQGASITWNKELTEKIAFKTEAFYSNFELDYSGQKTLFGFFEEGEKTNNIREIGASLESTIKLKNQHIFNAGYQFSSNDVSYVLNSFSELFEGTLVKESLSQINNTHVLFSEYEYKTPQLQIIAGLRGNYYSVVDKTYAEPRATAKVKLSDAFQAKAAFESKSQAVSQIIEFQSSNLGFGLENQVWTLASGDSIPIQRSRQVSTGIEFKKNKWTIDVEGYYRDIKGITTQTRGFRDISQFYTDGSSKTFGIDVLINKKINNYRTWIAYSYLNSEITINDFNFEDFEFNKETKIQGNYDITHNFSWSHAYNWKNFEVSLGWKIRTGRPYTRLNSITSDPEFIFLNYGETNAERLPTYHRLDFSSTYKFKFAEGSKWKGKLGISILNLYNRKNTLQRLYSIGEPLNDSDNTNYKVLKSDFLSFGLTPNVVFRVEF